ncbi:zinc finger protein [Aphelenchoides avenae]|nr:zinc finger protein [Aphelenchus avenae]
MVSSSKPNGTTTSSNGSHVVLDALDLTFELDASHSDGYLPPGDDPHKGLIDEIKKSLESEEALRMESERLLFDVRSKYSSQVQALNSAIVKASQRAICFLCGDSFVDEDQLKAHLAVVHLGKNHPLPSPQCRPSSAASTSTTAPVTSVGRMRPEKMCPVCEQVFASVQSMRRHVQRRHPDRVAECQERGHKEDKRLLPFVCETCSKSFATLAYLQSHTRRMHTVGKRFPCEICQRAYPLMAELRKHVKRVHGSNGTASAGSENESAQSTRSAEDTDATGEDMPMEL